MINRHEDLCKVCLCSVSHSLTNLAQPFFCKPTMAHQEAAWNECMVFGGSQSLKSLPRYSLSVSHVLYPFSHFLRDVDKGKFFCHHRIYPPAWIDHGWWNRTICTNTAQHCYIGLIMERALLKNIGFSFSPLSANSFPTDGNRHNPSMLKFKTVES